MIRLNVRKKDKVEVKSFVVKKDLLTYLNTLDFYGVVEVFYKDKTSKTIQEILTDKIWDLNVGTSEEHSDYIFAMAGKSRAGNIMLGGK